MKFSPTQKFLGGTAIAAILAVLYKKGRQIYSLQSLQFDLTKAKVVGFDKAYISIRVSNPTKSTITFNSINTELFFNGINIGRLYYNKPIIMNANAAQVFEFPVILYPAGEITLLTNIIQTKAKSGTFNIKGNVVVSGVQLPIDKTIKAW